jgi:hypothetical protein
MGRVINDHAVAWKFGYKVFYPQQTGLVLTTASEGAGGQLAANSGDGQLISMTMATADEVFWMLSIDDLADVDLSNDIQCRVTYDNSSAGSDTGVIWKVVMKGFAAGIALSDAAATPDGSATFAAAAPVASGGLMQTEWAALGVAGELASDAMVTVGVQLTDDGTTTADELELIALSLRYTRAFLDSSEQRQIT